MNEWGRLLIEHLLAWPVAVVAICLVFRGPLTDLVKELTAFIARSNHMSLKRGDTTLEAKADASLQAKAADERKDSIIGTGPATALTQASDSGDIVHERQQVLDYGKGSATVANWEQAIKAELERLNFPENDTQTFEMLVRQLATAVMIATFERLYRLIYGSQIDTLNALNTSGPQSPKIIEVIFFDTAKSSDTTFYEDVTFERWLSFLLNQALIVRSDELLTLTLHGRDFLVWMVNSGLSQVKPH